MRDDTALLGRKNIGPTIAARLAAVGIETVGELRAIGPAGAYKLLKASRPRMTLPVCYYLYSLQGALDGVRWDALSPATRMKLRKAAGMPSARPET
ncbi:MAG: TfoX/Sxy family DNA transformation protein [Steroidobacteraceae bacterium]